MLHIAIYYTRSKYTKHYTISQYIVLIGAATAPPNAPPASGSAARGAAPCPRPVTDTLQRGVQWIGGAVDWGSII